jgi:hypothetical protein
MTPAEATSPLPLKGAEARGSKPTCECLTGLQPATTDAQAC